MEKDIIVKARVTMPRTIYHQNITQILRYKKLHGEQSLTKEEEIFSQVSWLLQDLKLAITETGENYNAIITDYADVITKDELATSIRVLSLLSGAMEESIWNSAVLNAEIVK